MSLFYSKHYTFVYKELDSLIPKLASFCSFTVSPVFINTPYTSAINTTLNLICDPLRDIASSTNPLKWTLLLRKKGNDIPSLKLSRARSLDHAES